MSEKRNENAEVKGKLAHVELRNQKDSGGTWKHGAREEDADLQLPVQGKS